MRRRINSFITNIIVKLAKVSKNKTIHKLALKRMQYHANQVVNIAADIYKNGTEEEKAQLLKVFQSINN